VCHAQDEPAEMTVDWEAMRVRGRMGSGELLRVGCGERPGGSWTGKGGERIEWGEMRSVPVEEMVRGASGRRRERKGHSCCSRKTR